MSAEKQVVAQAKSEREAGMAPSETCPPSDSTTSLQIVSPMPPPSCGSLVDEPSWNGSLVVKIPGPSSTTRMRRQDSP